jgi:hypothetical protein
MSLNRRPWDLNRRAVSLDFRTSRAHFPDRERELLSQRFKVLEQKLLTISERADLIGGLLHAHVGMLRALLGAKPVPKSNPSEDKHWGRRKLARDQ